MRIKRRKRYLAEIIGNYALKARCFARIKLFIYNTGRVCFLLFVEYFEMCAMTLGHIFSNILVPICTICGFFLLLCLKKNYCSTTQSASTESWAALIDVAG